MYPHTSFVPRRSLFAIVAGLLTVPTVLFAQQDAPPVNVGELLKALKEVRQQQVTQTKTSINAAYQQISQAAGTKERAVALWESAIKATSMDGAGRENAQFKNWKDTTGEAFKEPEVQNAVRLHLVWLALSLQRSAGAPVKDMLPSLMSYAKELYADQLAMDALRAEIKREKEAAAANPKKGQRSRDDAATERTHNQVLSRSVADGVVSDWMKLNDYLKIEKWEFNAGNLDGIYRNIILPELRAQKDQRVFEYWDAKMRRESDVATQSKLAFEIEKFNSVRGPSLLWNRAQELVAIGQKNRAATEMFGLIKKYPNHPDADQWVNTLEQLLAPPAADPAAPAAGTAAAPPAPAPLPGQ